VILTAVVFIVKSRKLDSDSNLPRLVFLALGGLGWAEALDGLGWAGALSSPI